MVGRLHSSIDNLVCSQVGIDRTVSLLGFDPKQGTQGQEPSYSPLGNPPRGRRWDGAKDQGSGCRIRHAQERMQGDGAH